LIGQPPLSMGAIKIVRLSGAAADRTGPGERFRSMAELAHPAEEPQDCAKRLRQASFWHPFQYSPSGDVSAPSTEISSSWIRSGGLVHPGRKFPEESR
jgi:hypothetical protein